MQEVEGQTDLRGVEPGMLFWETALSLHVKHQVSTVDKLDDKKQPAAEQRLLNEAGRALHNNYYIASRIYLKIFPNQFKARLLPMGTI